MRQTVTTLEMRERLGELLDRVRLRQEELVIERKGKPVAALVPIERLEQMQRAARQTVLALLDRQRGGDLTDEKAMRLADEAKHASRPRPRPKKRR
jgi:prevent-host-death family protein